MAVIFKSEILIQIVRLISKLTQHPLTYIIQYWSAAMFAWKPINK